MKVGDLIRNKRHPQAGLGIVVEVGAPAKLPTSDVRGCVKLPDYVIAVWPDHGEEVAYADEIEVISAKA